MASLGTPKTWIPYGYNKDCSQGFCSVYCPQWCYIIFPPPPPPPFFQFPDDNSSPNFSPLVIAIIGILASAFLLVSYYTIISKYCGSSVSSRRIDEYHRRNENFEDNGNHPSLHEPWHAATTGLDEALIRSITVCKYKREDGLIEGTDCSVCLSEFQEDESLRLLPKCSHAFHVPCIDTWLRSHSNCPLCRANIVFFGASQPQLPPPPVPVTETPGGEGDNESLQENRRGNDINTAMAATRDTGGGRIAAAGDEQVTLNPPIRPPKTPLQGLSDLGNLEQRDTIIEIRNEDEYQHIRRSVSMDHPCQNHASIADILRMNGDEVIGAEVCSGDVGTSKHSAEVSKRIMSSHRRRVLDCVLNPVTMKRSFSSGRFSLTGHGRVRDTISPL